MSQAPNPNKDAWIQRAKALLFDCRFAMDSATLIEEAEDLIEQGGGYDCEKETSTTKLRWTK